MIRNCWAILAALLVSVTAQSQSLPQDTDESAYSSSTLAKILGGEARSRNDEAELAGPTQWFHTTATFTGRTRPPSGRNRPLIGAWMSSRGLDASLVEPYFSGDLPELEFEQGGRKFWVLAGMPGGLGFDVYPAGQKLTIYLQRVGFSSGTPIAVLTLVKIPGGATTAAAPQGRTLRHARLGEGARRQEAVYRQGSATFTYAGRKYSLPLDAAGRHSLTPGLYSYENGVRTALLEFGAGDDQYLLLRVAADGSRDVVPYLVLNGRIVPPIDLSSCRVDVEQTSRELAGGSVDCSGAARSVLGTLRFHAD